MHAKEKYKKLQNFLTLWKESTEEIKKKKKHFIVILQMRRRRKKKFLFAKEKKELTRLCPIVERLQIQNQV